jgi:hypothetical protein
MQGDADRLEQALQRRNGINAVDMPLRDFADRLSQQFGVPIDLDVKKLEESGVNIDTPINMRLDSIPLESILQRVLSDLELTFTIRNHVILITTPEEAESQLTTKIYPVRDLVFTGAGKDGLGEDYDSLIELITTTIEPQTWDEVGGPGSISGFEIASSLVISQTDDIHRAVEPLLVKLRHVRGLQGIPSAALPPAAGGKKSPTRRIAGRPAPAKPVHITGPATQTWQVPQVYASE